MLLLLSHLLWELILVGVRGNIGHLTLHLEVGRQVLLRLDHAHVHVLLVSGSDLLLLLLQDLNLLSNGELFHH